MLTLTAIVLLYVVYRYVTMLAPEHAKLLALVFLILTVLVVVGRGAWVTSLVP